MVPIFGQSPSKLSEGSKIKMVNFSEKATVYLLHRCQFINRSTQEDDMLCSFNVSLNISKEQKAQQLCDFVCYSYHYYCT